MAAYADANIHQLDIDLDGEVTALTDGLLLIRYLFGFRDDALVKGALSSQASMGAILRRLLSRLIN